MSPRTADRSARLCKSPSNAGPEGLAAVNDRRVGKDAGIHKGTRLQHCKKYVECSTIVYPSQQPRMWLQKLLGPGMVETMVRKMKLFTTN